MICYTSRPYNEIIDQLDKAPNGFYITGSRAWGNHHSDSDWDFFAQDTTAVRKFLRDLGFRSEHKSGYQDSLTKTVMVHSRGEGHRQVHVQLVSNAAAKAVVQAQLMKLYPNGFINKQQARELWQLGIAIVTA